MPTCIHTGAQFRILREMPLPFDKYKGIVYWHLEDFSNGISLDEQERIFREVFAQWNIHFSPLEFRQTYDSSLALIKIHFSGYRLGTFSRILTRIFPKLKRYFRIEPIPFDSEGLLGYGYEYGSNYNPCNLYIKDNHDWITGKYKLFLIALHELGHVFNLGHTQENHPKEIMQEFYENDMVITQDSIDAINHLYSDLKKKYTNVITTTLS